MDIFNFEKRQILLVFPYSPWRWLAPSLGIAYIASALENIGIKVEFIDCQITRHYKEKILSLLSEYPVVGLSVNAGNVSSAIDIAGAIRKTSAKTKIIMGGPHATAIYERLIPEYADIVVRGEGEDTVVELMREEDLNKVKGIAYWDGDVKVNAPRPFIEDLDRLRFPAWHLFELERYRYANSYIPFVFMGTSRGCPYDCIYCTKFVHGYKIRLRTAENLIGELEYLINKFKIKEINISDDCFTFYPERIKQFCKLIIKSGFNKRVCFSGTNGIRPDICDPEMFKLLKQAGFNKLFFSIESGSQKILDKIGRGYNIAKVKETIRMAKKAGLEIHAFFTMGFLFETLDDIQMTVDLAKSLPIGNASFAMVVPLVGTKLYEMMVNEQGKFPYDLITNSVGFDVKAVCHSSILHPEEIEKMHRRAYRQFYLRPSQIYNALNLKKIKSFGDFFCRLNYGWNIFFRGGQIRERKI